MADRADAPALVDPAGWASLRRHTAARIALGRAGHSMPTASHLAFQLAHAQARDAVHLPFDPAGVEAALAARGFASLALHSAAADRATYLQRPDLGRRLDETSRDRLVRWHHDAAPGGPAPCVDLAFAVVDGLSALAVHEHAVALVSATVARLRDDGEGAWTVAPVAVVSQGRVAIGDEIGAALGARAVAVLIGERPGLSSPDSLGVYLTWAPRPGLTDARRNCISNVRPAGLGIAAAAAKLHQLLVAARRLRLTGVTLKDDVDDAPPVASADDGSARIGNFLLPPADG